MQGHDTVEDNLKNKTVFATFLLQFNEHCAAPDVHTLATWGQYNADDNPVKSYMELLMLRQANVANCYLKLKKLLLLVHAKVEAQHSRLFGLFHEVSQETQQTEAQFSGPFSSVMAAITRPSLCCR